MNKDFKLVAEKMKLVMKDMNVRPEVEDRLSDLLTIIMWEDELKPLILKKEWEVKNEEEDLERALDFKINKWGFETKNN